MFTDRSSVHGPVEKCRVWSFSGSYRCQFGGLIGPFSANHFCNVASCECIVIRRISGCDDWCTVLLSTFHPPTSRDSRYIASASRLSESCFLVERPGISGTTNPGYTGQYFLWWRWRGSSLSASPPPTAAVPTGGRRQPKRPARQQLFHDISSSLCDRGDVLSASRHPSAGTWRVPRARDCTYQLLPPCP